MKIGDYIIVNECDRPWTRNINKITQIDVDSGIFHSQYICQDTMVEKYVGRLTAATLVNDFGVKIIFEDDSIGTQIIALSMAKYSDGRTRKWQDSYANFHKLRPQFLRRD